MIKVISIGLMAALAAGGIVRQQDEAADVARQQIQPLKPLKVSPNGRYFMTADGKPFFWLGDTGWLLFSKLKREEAIKYLDDRKQKGFNVIQVMVLHTTAVVNAYGDTALIQRNVAQPNTTPG